MGIRKTATAHIMALMGTAIIHGGMQGYRQKRVTTEPAAKHNTANKRELVRRAKFNKAVQAKNLRKKMKRKRKDRRR